ncbi:hypothetical protein N836_30585 [Leptolyngbya sp. Heron Island J]|nr:hypothetical protein N836_30585 [Leptolyngbya sp. Heron Island J]
MTDIVTAEENRKLDFKDDLDEIAESIRLVAPLDSENLNIDFHF